MKLPEALVRQAAYNAGFRGSHLDAAVMIAECESGFNPEAKCLNCFGVSEDSRGLWQINLNAHPQYKNVNLFDPQINANAAYQVYLESNSSFRPWYNCANKLGYLNFPNTNEKKSNYLALAVIAFLLVRA
jgi:hypothetical protein